MKKRELRKALKDLKKKIGRENFITKRKRYKEWCKEQKKKHEEEEEIKIRSIKSEAEAWKYINKYKEKKTEWTKMEISEESTS